MPVELPNLHDAILRRIEIDWEGGCARCVLDVWFGRPMADPAAEMRPLVVTLTGLKAATVPRAEPWGPSIYVNSGRLSDGNGAAELAIEMQSGDEIVLRTTTVDVAFGQ